MSQSHSRPPVTFPHVVVILVFVRIERSVVWIVVRVLSRLRLVRSRTKYLRDVDAKPNERKRCKTSYYIDNQSFTRLLTPGYSALGHLRKHCRKVSQPTQVTYGRSGSHWHEGSVTSAKSRKANAVFILAIVKKGSFVLLVLPFHFPKAFFLCPLMAANLNWPSVINVRRTTKCA